MAVDSQVRTPDGHAFDVIYVGTTKGRILKIVNTADPNGGLAQRPVFIEELILYPASVPVDKLKVVRDEQGSRAKLVVLTKDQVAAVPLARCSLLAKSCGVCIALQDPYCAWSVRDGQCVSLVNSDPDRLDSAAYLQVSQFSFILHLTQANFGKKNPKALRLSWWSKSTIMLRYFLTE